MFCPCRALPDPAAAAVAPHLAHPHGPPGPTGPGAHTHGPGFFRGREGQPPAPELRPSHRQVENCERLNPLWDPFLLLTRGICPSHPHLCIAPTAIAIVTVNASRMNAEQAEIRSANKAAPARPIALKFGHTTSTTTTTSSSSSSSAGYSAVKKDFSSSIAEASSAILNRHRGTGTGTATGTSAITLSGTGAADDDDDDDDDGEMRWVSLSRLLSLIRLVVHPIVHCSLV